MSIFICDDETILNLEYFNYISKYSHTISDEKKYVIRVEFDECSYADLSFGKEIERDRQHDKILEHIKTWYNCD